MTFLQKSSPFLSDQTRSPRLAARHSPPRSFPTLRCSPPRRAAEIPRASSPSSTPPAPLQFAASSSSSRPSSTSPATTAWGRRRRQLRKSTPTKADPPQHPRLLLLQGAGYLSVAAEAASRSWVAWTKKKKKSARRSRWVAVATSVAGWAAVLGPTVDALVTSVHDGGATAAGVLPNSRSRVAGLGAPGLRPGMREGRRVEPTVSRGIAACRGVAAEEQLGGGEARLRSAAKQGRRKMAAAGQVGGGASGTSSWLILRRLGHAVPVGNRGRRRLGRARCRPASGEEEGPISTRFKMKKGFSAKL
ncbi:uncharacterized protein LOC125532641 [Triticum urartu]|uniref:uncharacterized protein LOC125532641 n=1 Tax=Triticum urartu TaxID=4572 RepID=UPI002044044F|nr:uncharacterized protein LOC125532641 [Triticum urartu]